MYDDQFNPRYTFVYDCLSSEKGPANPNIWLCVSCHKCEETCPYEVSPIRFIEALKSEAMNNGLVHNLLKDEVAQIVSTGYAFLLTGVTDRQRKELNLEPLKPRGTSDLSVLIKRTGFSEKLEGTNR
jgi:heterodisulfide reductase subunit C